jgi:hypothetical protein
MRPSFIAAGVNGFLMLCVVIYVVFSWKELGNYERMILMSLIALQIGIHALLHHVEEIFYGFNPLENQWDHGKLKR